MKECGGHRPPLQMKTLYLDIFSGISGDMFIGAMIDLGVDAQALERELEKLKLDGWRVHAARGQKMGIAGVKFDVRLAHEHSHEHTHADGTTHTHPHSHAHGHEPDHEPGRSHHEREQGPHGGPLLKTSFGKVELSVFETHVPPRFRLYFFDASGKPLAPIAAKTVILEAVRSKKKRQLFQFKRQGDYLEATEELPEPHEFTAVLRLKLGSRTEKRETEFVEDHHHHDDRDDGHGHAHGHEHGRNFAQIKELIQRSALSDWARNKSIAVFERIAVAEGKIHGLPPEQVHFHEVGAMDSIVDIVGACVALELLGKPRVLAAPVVEGTGFIRCAHGRFPLPAPATLEILSARGVGVTQCDEPHELVTPTGAALLAEFAESFGPMQGLIATQIGYGLGTRDHQTRPNVLRAVLGESDAAFRTPRSALDWETDTIAVVETNLDDITAEFLGHFVEKAFAEGALDVFHTPIQMKKNRPGVLLTVLCAAADADRFSELMLRETSAFGVRRSTHERRKLKRELMKVKTEFGEVTVKVGKLNGKIVQVAPEFESCKKLAEQTGVVLKMIYETAMNQMTKNE
ncbi:MAG: nickel pincer cofactor biosynthesis protein LarC [Verrucomicrobia bacterium]|nr:MAG: nickel pincer cofactor biosynthesis protein LarC [Verrucomicrobiota bacterium]